MSHELIHMTQSSNISPRYIQRVLPATTICGPRDFNYTSHELMILGTNSFICLDHRVHDSFIRDMTHSYEIWLLSCHTQALGHPCPPNISPGEFCLSLVSVDHETADTTTHYTERVEGASRTLRASVTNSMCVTSVCGYIYETAGKTTHSTERIEGASRTLELCVT